MLGHVHTHPRTRTHAYTASAVCVHTRVCISACMYSSINKYIYMLAAHLIDEDFKADGHTRKSLWRLQQVWRGWGQGVGRVTGEVYGECRGMV